VSCSLLNLILLLQCTNHSAHDTTNPHQAVTTFTARMKGRSRKGESVQERAHGSHVVPRKPWIAFVSPSTEVPVNLQGGLDVSYACLSPRSGTFSGSGLRRYLTACTCCMPWTKMIRWNDSTCAAELKSHLENDYVFANRLTFSDEATFHWSGKVNRHNVRIWGTETPHVAIEHERDSPKVNVFCAISRTRVFGPFLFAEKKVTGITYLDMLTECLFP
jgi:hypothetical protein